ncbi:phosphoketolase family protein [Streptomyces sp. NPDC002851]
MTETAVLADALWRATVYASVCQLHLRDNVLLSQPLAAEHVKERPSGHWGTVPGTAWALSHVVLAAGQLDRRVDLVPLIGAGHAGVVQLAASWVTGELGKARSLFSTDAEGLRLLAQSFPDVDDLGSEVTPALPAGGFLGGRLGGCLPFAQGAALDAPGRVVVPIIGDGECETPTTAASWLGQTALDGASVLPIVHVNGFRMGDRSLLGAMNDNELHAYFNGLGWAVRLVQVVTGSPQEHTDFQMALWDALERTLLGRRTVLVLRCVKGWGGPASLGDSALLGTPRLHKTPLVTPRTDPEQLARLGYWLASYRPADLFDADGRARGVLAEAVATSRWCSFLPAERPDSVEKTLAYQEAATFSEAVTDVVTKHASRGDFRVFSPDELSSNRLPDLADEQWSHELLAEEVLLEWLAGWTASGRRGVVVSYEGFAPLFASGLVSHIKQRRMAGVRSLPSLNLLLTSYGWHNVPSHGDPSLATTLLGLQVPAVRVLTPADPTRTAVALDEAFDSVGKVNLVVAGKHTRTAYPTATIEEESQRGLAIWPHLSDDGEPDLAIVTAGDIPAAVAADAVDHVRARHGCRIRVVNLLDLTVLGSPRVWERGLSAGEIDQYLGTHSAVLILTLGHPAAVWGLLAGRLQRPVDIIGWQEPPGPLPQRFLAHALSMDRAGVERAAGHLLGSREVVR